MIAELRAKSQITIPKEITAKFSLNTGDKLDIIEKDGMICMIPVEVYPKAYIDGLKAEIEEVKTRIANGEQPIFDNVDDLFAKLEED